MTILVGEAYVTALFAARGRGEEKKFVAEQTVAREADPVWIARIAEREAREAGKNAEFELLKKRVVADLVRDGHSTIVGGYGI